MSWLVRPGRRELTTSTTRFMSLLINVNSECPIKGLLQPISWRAEDPIVITPNKKVFGSRGSKIWLIKKPYLPVRI